VRTEDWVVRSDIEGVGGKRGDLKIKSQISSTKLQINLKSQCSMTKTFIRFVSHILAYLNLPVMIFWGTVVDGFFVLNFEFGKLEFV
jgi:hypothetical protein